MPSVATRLQSGLGYIPAGCIYGLGTTTHTLAMCDQDTRVSPVYIYGTVQLKIFTLEGMGRGDLRTLLISFNSLTTYFLTRLLTRTDSGIPDGTRYWIGLLERYTLVQCTILIFIFSAFNIGGLGVLLLLLLLLLLRDYRLWEALYE